jgi:hypothetical protein
MVLWNLSGGCVTEGWRHLPLSMSGNIVGDVLTTQRQYARCAAFRRAHQGVSVDKFSSLHVILSRCVLYIIGRAIVIAVITPVRPQYKDVYGT